MIRRISSIARGRLSPLVVSLLLGGSLSATPPALPTFAPVQFHPPKPERYVMDNGLTVFLLEDHELPLIKVAAVVRSGSQYDPPDKVGLGSIFGPSMTLGGSLSNKPEDIERLLDKTASSVEFAMSVEDASGNMSCRALDFDKIFAVFVDLFLYPQFRKDQLELAKSKVLENLRRMNDDPEEMTRREFRRLVYGDLHPYGRFPTPGGVRSISRDDVLHVHARYFHPNLTWLAVSGDFKSDEMKARLQKAFGAWPRGDVSLPALPPVPDPGSSQVSYIQRPISQTQIRIGHLGFERHNADHFAWEVFNELWGGGATSELFRTVRTQQGLAYSVGSTWSEPAGRGLILAVCQTRGPQSIAALQSILKINQAVRDAPFATADIDRAKQSIQNRFIEHYQSSAQIATEIMSDEYFGFPDDYLDTYTDHIAKVSRDDLKRVGQTHLRPEWNKILVVGDLSTFEKPLSTIGKPREVKPLDYSDRDEPSFERK